MRRLHHAIKRLEEVEGIDRARRLSEEEGIWIEMMLTDVEVSRVARRIANMERKHGKESAEYQSAVEEADPVFEQGMERYKKKQAAEAGRRAGVMR